MSDPLCDPLGVNGPDGGAEEVAVHGKARRELDIGLEHSPPPAPTNTADGGAAPAGEETPPPAAQPAPRTGIHRIDASKPMSASEREELKEKGSTTASFKFDPFQAPQVVKLSEKQEATVQKARVDAKNVTGMFSSSSASSANSDLDELFEVAPEKREDKIKRAQLFDNKKAAEDDTKVDDLFVAALVTHDEGAADVEGLPEVTGEDAEELNFEGTADVDALEAEVKKREARDKKAPAPAKQLDQNYSEKRPERQAAAASAGFLDDMFGSAPAKKDEGEIDLASVDIQAYVAQHKSAKKKGLFD
eukprot:TRINITY_DN917_c1_g1_i2.p1 TRINITY_DN917_c1_g1~~TRINITY_DN917_c1_g1_i2.p1  ORF type:complete len:304 (-),score=101.06 TRINITY_DN917_c1_g1_i2:72-983(-)